MGERFREAEAERRRAGQKPLKRIVPMKSPGETEKFLTRQFFGSSALFIKNHARQYREFLENEKLRDTTEVRTQYAAAMMSFSLGRYGGILGVNFKKTNERGDVKPLSKVEPEVRERRQMYGAKFSVLLNDLLAGSQYTDPKSKAPYRTYGDCDEIALLVCQLIRALGGQKMEPTVYRLDPEHAYACFRIGGRLFLFDPSMGNQDYPESLEGKLREHVDAAAMAQKNPGTRNRAGMAYLGKKAQAALDALKKSKGEAMPLFKDAYERVVMPQIRRRLAAALPAISKGARVEMEAAFAKAREPHDVYRFAIEKEAGRRKWGYEKREIFDSAIVDFIKDNYGTPEGRKMCIKVLADFTAASTPGKYEQNLSGIRRILAKMDDNGRLSFIRRVLWDGEKEGTRYTLKGLEELAKGWS